MSYCEHCQFFMIEMIQGPTPGDRLLGHCHRFPPPKGQRTPLKAEAANAEPSAFPLVRGSDWCGEFQQTATPMRRMSAPVSKKEPAPDRRLVVSSGEAAEMLGISPKHLYKLSLHDNLKRVQIGARVCYRVETLKAWIETHEHSGERQLDD